MAHDNCDHTADDASEAMQAELTASLLHDQAERNLLASLQPGAPDFPAHALAAAFPLLTGDEFEALVADVKAYGVRDPVTLWAGEILDGRNRVAAAKVAGVTTLKTIRFKGSDAEALYFVTSANLTRRHLSTSQRALIAAELANIRAGEFAGNQHVDEPSANLQTPLVSQATASKALRVSTRSVATATKIKKKAEPALLEDVKQGRVTLNAAERALRAAKPTAAATEPKISEKPTVSKKPKLRPLQEIVEDLQRLHDEVLAHHERAAGKLQDRSERWLESEAG